MGYLPWQHLTAQTVAVAALMARRFITQHSYQSVEPAAAAAAAAATAAASSSSEAARNAFSASQAGVAWYLRYSFCGSSAQEYQPIVAEVARRQEDSFQITARSAGCSGYALRKNASTVKTSEKTTATK